MVNQNNKRAAIVSVLIFLVWLAAMLGFGKISFLPVHFFVSLVFGILAFGINIVFLVIFGRESAEKNEIKHLPLLFTMGYLVVSLSANFIFRFYFTTIGIVVFFNILFICVVFGGGYFSGVSAMGAEKKVNILENKQSMHLLISQKLGKALALAKDEEVKSSLLKLKELADYSNSLTTNMSENVEDALYNKVNSLENMLIHGEDKEKILERIEDIIVDVKYRNAIKSV